MQVAVSLFNHVFDDSSKVNILLSDEGLHVRNR